MFQKVYKFNDQMIVYFKEVKLEDDDVLSELINEIDDCDTAAASSSFSQPFIKPQLATSYNTLTEKQAAKDYMKSFARPKLKISTLKNKENTPVNIIPKVSLITNEIKCTENEVHEDIAMDVEEKNCEDIAKLCNEDNTVDGQKELINTEISDMFDDDFDMTQIEDIETENSSSNNQTESEMITEEQLLIGWETMQENVSNIEQKQVQVDVTQPPLVNAENGEKVGVT